jgi:hypothetical protein
MSARRWYTLGEGTVVSNDEARLASTLTAITEGMSAEILQVSALDIKGNTDTSVLVVDRGYEHLAFITRMDGSIVVATDSYALS